jgi:STE24 endopeptidase
MDLQHQSFAFALVFALMVGLDGAIKLLLADRQVRHVARHRDALPKAFEGIVTLGAHRRAADYTIAKMRLATVEVLFGTAVLLGWTLFGGLDALNTLLLGWLGRGMTQQLALLAAFALVGALIDLPFAWYRTFVLEQRFGFNRSDARTFWLDELKGLAVAALLGLPLAWAILALMDGAGGHWWLWAWGLWVAFVLAMMLIYPGVIAPLFNRFSPLADEALKARVEALLARTGFAAKGLYVMDGSRRSAHANAYFTGLGRAKRIVFFDTLLGKLTPSEIEAVLAHELGHFKHRHLAKRLAWMLLSSLAGFALLGWLSQQVWFYQGLGVRPNLGAPSDALALLLFLLAVPVFTFVLAPLSAYFSRKHEFEADAFAGSTADRQQLAAALIKLTEDNAATLTPDPWFVAWYYSHPPTGQRLERLGATSPLPT